MPALKNTVNDVRFVGRIAGRYTLPRHRAESGLSVFACRTHGITPDSATISAPVIGKIGDPVSVNFNDIGMVHGTVSRLIEDGFAIKFEMSQDDTNKLSARIDWVKKKSLRDVADSRSHRRKTLPNSYPQ